MIIQANYQKHYILELINVSKSGVQNRGRVIKKGFDFMIKYGLIILKKYDVIYGVQTKNVLIWNDNQELKAIIFEHAITNNIEYLIKNYINCVYTSILILKIFVSIKIVLLI